MSFWISLHDRMMVAQCHCPWQGKATYAGRTDHACLAIISSSLDPSLARLTVDDTVSRLSYMDSKSVWAIASDQSKLVLQRCWFRALGLKAMPVTPAELTLNSRAFHCASKSGSEGAKARAVAPHLVGRCGSHTPFEHWEEKRAKSGKQNRSPSLHTSHTVNSSVVQLTQQLSASKTRARHLSMRASWLHHLVKHEHVSMQFAPTAHQKTDVLTKGLTAYVTCQTRSWSPDLRWRKVCVELPDSSRERHHEIDYRMLAFQRGPLLGGSMSS